MNNFKENNKKIEKLNSNDLINQGLLFTVVAAISCWTISFFFVYGFKVDTLNVEDKFKRNIVIATSLVSLLNLVWFSLASWWNKNREEAIFAQFESEKEQILKYAKEEIRELKKDLILAQSKLKELQEKGS